MKKTCLAAIAASLLAVPALAAVATPPVGSGQQWWTHPIGCEYSRAGRPGETMWFLIINTAKPGCPTYIKGKSWGGVYQDQGRTIRR